MTDTFIGGILFLSEYLISGSWKLSVMFQYIKFMIILNELDMSVSMVIAIY